MTTERRRPSRIGIWGIQASGKTSFFNALDVVLNKHNFGVVPKGDPAKVWSYNEGVARFRRQMYAIPTPAQYLRLQHSESISTATRPVVPPGVPTVVSPDPSPAESESSVGSNLFLDSIQASVESGTYEQAEQQDVGTSDERRTRNGDSNYDVIEEDNILKLQITFPRTRDEIINLNFAGENPEDWVDQTFEVWLPDHGGETWTGESHRDLMQSMIQFYSQPEFTGFMFFFDPTFQSEDGKNILGVDVPYYETFRNFISGLQQTRGEARLNAHCAVILTKTDEPRFREYAVSTDVASQYYPELLAQLVLGKDGFNQLRSAFESGGTSQNSYLKCFCTSSAGISKIGANFVKTSTGENGMKDSPQPQGVEESFLWLVSQIAHFPKKPGKTSRLSWLGKPK